MGSSTINKIAGSGVLGVVGLGLRKMKLKSEKKGRQDLQASQDAKKRIEEEEKARQKALAIEASIKKQEELNRKKTTFAGGDMQQNIFRKTLGSGMGSTTLGS